MSNGAEHLPEYGEVTDWEGLRQLADPDLIAQARAQGAGWADPSHWPIEKREASRKLLALADAAEALTAERDALRASFQEAEQIHEGVVRRLADERDALRAQLDGMFERREWGFQVGTWPPTGCQTLEMARWYAGHPFANQVEYEHKVVTRRTLVGPWVEVTEQEGNPND